MFLLVGQCIGKCCCITVNSSLRSAAFLGAPPQLIALKKFDELETEKLHNFSLQLVRFIYLKMQHSLPRRQSIVVPPGHVELGYRYMKTMIHRENKLAYL